MKNKSRNSTIGAFIILMLVIQELPRCQSIQNISITSELQFSMSNNELKSFPILVEKGDEVNIQNEVLATTNFQVLTPEATVVYEAVMGKKSPVNWQKKFNQSGVYQIAYEDVSWFKHNEVKAKINLKRANFCYGACGNETEKVLNYRTDTIITSGTFKASYSNEKNYPINALKGDTVIIALQPISGVIPAFEIANNLGEILHCQEISREIFKKEFLVCATGVLTLKFYPPSFTEKIKRFIPSTIDIKIQRISPKRVDSLSLVVENSESVSVAYDTIAELNLDTLIRLGAQRDIVNRPKANINIGFKNPEELAYYAILFGSGADFINQVNESNGTLMQQNRELVQAICEEGYNIRFAPQNKDIVFKFSADINDAIALNDHLKKVEYFNTQSNLTVQNKNQVLAQEVYVKVVGFRLVEK